MNGYKMYADSYRKMMETGRMPEDVAKAEIRVYDFLSECTKDDIHRLFDSGAFNSVVKAYVKMACEGLEYTKEQKAAMMDELRYLFDTVRAGEIGE